MDDMGFRLSQREKDLAAAEQKLVKLRSESAEEGNSRQALEEQLKVVQRDHAREREQLTTEISVLQGDNEQIKKNLVKLIKLVLRQTLLKCQLIKPRICPYLGPIQAISG